VTNQEGLLKLRIKGARDDSVSNIVARNHIEARVRIDACDSQMSRAEKRDERCIRRVTVDPPREGTPPAG
jgi:hypothetical protein